MRTHWLHGPCYNRRTVFGLALTPLLVSTVRAGDAAAMAPQPDDHLVFLTGPKRYKCTRPLPTERYAINRASIL